MAYRYLFGPVKSRRLGLSLGVDLVLPKICSLDCVYCESGKTTQLVMERKEYISTLKLQQEIENYFQHHDLDHNIEWVTLSGAGEPTLASNMGDIIQFLIALRENLNKTFQIALITNSTLLMDNQVIKELQNVDMVCPSLDAMDEETYQRLKKPHPEATLEKILQGLKKLRKEYTGLISLEIFVLPQYNFNQKEMHLLRKEIVELKVDQIFINTLDRPGVLKDLLPLTSEEYVLVKEWLNLPQIVLPGDVILHKPSSKKVNTEFKNDELKKNLLEYVRRRPGTVEDFMESFEVSKVQVEEALDQLMGILEISKQKRGEFYQIKRF